MPQTVKGVISRSKGAPVELTDIVIPDPGPGEVVVDVKSCGVCHTDFHYREGGISDDYPFLLGHESAGTVSRSAKASPTSRWATSSSSTGAPSAVSAGPASAANPGTASTPITLRRR